MSVMEDDMTEEDFMVEDFSEVKDEDMIWET